MRLSMMEQVMDGLKDPNVRAVIAKVAPSLAPLIQRCSEESEMEKVGAIEAEDARVGLPASSRPGQKPLPLIEHPRPETMRFPRKQTQDVVKANQQTVEPSLNGPSGIAAKEQQSKGETKDSKETKQIKEPVKEVKVPPMDKSVIETDGTAEVNSSTHRAAHARLTRRMSSLDVSKFPQMARLWGGSRKERCIFGC